MKVSFIGPLAWNEESAHGLAKTYLEDDLPRMVSGIASGRYLLFRAVVNDVCCGWLIAERLKDELFIWCYQGAEPDFILQALAVHAKRGGLKKVGFFTRRPGWQRRMRRYMPDVSRTLLEGEVRFTFNVEELCKHGSETV